MQQREVTPHGGSETSSEPVIMSPARGGGGGGVLAVPHTNIQQHQSSEKHMQRRKMKLQRKEHKTSPQQEKRKIMIRNLPSSFTREQFMLLEPVQKLFVVEDRRGEKEETQSKSHGVVASDADAGNGDNASNGGEEQTKASKDTDGEKKQQQQQQLLDKKKCDWLYYRQGSRLAATHHEQIYNRIPSVCYMHFTDHQHVIEFVREWEELLCKFVYPEGRPSTALPLQQQKPKAKCPDPPAHLSAPAIVALKSLQSHGVHSNDVDRSVYYQSISEQLDEERDLFYITVEYAPFQKVPNEKIGRNDPKQGTIEQDEDYLKWLDHRGKPVEKVMGADKQLELQSEEGTNTKNGMIMTPLMASLKASKLNKLSKKEKAQKKKQKKQQQQQQQQKKAQEKQKNKQRQHKRDKSALNKESTESSPQVLRPHSPSPHQPQSQPQPQPQPQQKQQKQQQQQQQKPQRQGRPRRNEKKISRGVRYVLEDDTSQNSSQSTSKSQQGRKAQGSRQRGRRGGNNAGDNKKDSTVQE